MFTVFQLGVYTGIHSLPHVHLEEGKKLAKHHSPNSRRHVRSKKKTQKRASMLLYSNFRLGRGVRVGDIESELSRIESGVET